MIKKTFVSISSKILKWELLGILWLAFLLNQADRQIFSVLLPLIREDLCLSDVELGLIASVLIWTYGLMMPIAGYLGDKYPRRNIVGFCLMFWSLATFFTGFCSSLVQFILVRGVSTGGGEAFYAPSANALIAEKYKDNKSFVLSLHQTAVYFGIVLSGILAGYIGEYYGWRQAFYVFGLAGCLLAVLFFFRIPKDVIEEECKAQRSMFSEMLITSRVFFRKPTVVLLTLAFGCMVFVNVGYLSWMPLFLSEKFSLNLVDAGFSSLFYHHIGAFLGILSGGKLADNFAKVIPKSRVIIQALGLTFGAPFIYVISTSDTEIGTYLALFLFGIFRGWFDSNIVASLYELVKPQVRSSTYGLMLACAFLIGSIAPLILGIIKPIFGLEVGLSSLSIVYLLGATFLWVGAYYYFDQDREISI